jgi:hypothetical protein
MVFTAGLLSLLVVLGGAQLDLKLALPPFAPGMGGVQ